MACVMDRMGRKDFMDTNVCVIGGGPAGLFAAISSARAGAKTVVVEENMTAGRK